MRIPRVISEKARRPKPEGRPPLAVGSRGGCRNVTFMWHVIARFQLASPAKGRGTAHGGGGVFAN